MSTHFVHDIDPAIGHIFGLAVYWYGSVYTVGFLGVFLWLWLRRNRLGWSHRDVIDFTIFAGIGILAGGRIFDVTVYEWAYYKDTPLKILNLWTGGLASHGVLLGSALGALLFCLLYRKSFLELADEVVVPAAFLFAVGRLGNFIEGGVIGSQTDVPWGVVYSNLEGARHPVALYESAKNFLIVFILIAVLRRFPAGKGIAMAVFVFSYAILRLFVDSFRDYESYWLGLGKGQFFNLIMAAIGLGLLVWFSVFHKSSAARAKPLPPEMPVGMFRPMLLALLLLYPLGIPTSWTQTNIEKIRQGSVNGETSG